MSTSAQARAWSFTWQYPYALLLESDFPGASHLVYQEELCPTTHNPHVQGYVKFEKRLRLQQVKTMFVNAAEYGSRVHIEVAKGSPQQNYKYCTKLDSRTHATEDPYVYGEFKDKAQGKRNDILALRDAIKTGSSFMALVDDDELAPTVAGNMRFVERCHAEYNIPAGRTDVHVTLCLGPAGSGKTYCATQGNPHAPGIYFKDEGQWWEGYTGQKTVVLDEFSGSTMAPLTFQRVCDVYPFTVPIKGRSHPLLANDIRLTSNFLPSRWWKEGTRYNQDAIFRRIHEVHYHPKQSEVVKYTHTHNEDGTWVYAMDKFLYANHFMPGGVQ